MDQENRKSFLSSPKTVPPVRLLGVGRNTAGHSLTALTENCVCSFLHTHTLIAKLDYDSEMTIVAIMGSSEIHNNITRRPTVHNYLLLLAVVTAFCPA